MSKGLRYAGFALAGAVLLVVALLVLVRFLITSDQVRKAVLPKIRQALHREVVLKDVDISLFSGIILRDVSIMDRQGDMPFVAADAVVLRYRFWPLLRRKVVVDEVRLEQPRVRIVRHPDGSFNFSDLLASKSASSTQEPEENAAQSARALPLDLTVSEMLLQNGQVRFVDYCVNPDQPFTLELSHVTLRAAEISAARPFPVEVGINIERAELAVKGQLDPVAREAKLAVTLSDLNLPDFAPYYQKNAAVGIASLKVDGRVDLEGGAQRLDTAGRIDLREIRMTLADGGDPVAVPDISVQYDMAVDRPANRVALKQGRLQVGDWPVAVQGQLSPFDGAPTFSGTLDVPPIDLAALGKALPAAMAKQLSGLRPTGSLQASLQMQGPLNRPRSLLKKGTVTLDKVAVSLGALRPRLSGSLALAGDALQGRALELMLGDDRALLDLAADNLLGRPIQITSDLTAERLQLDALAGGGNGREKTGAAGTGRAAEKRTLGPYDLPLVAQGTMQVGQATWRGLEITDLVARYRLENNILTLAQFGGKTAGGTFAETARVDLGQPGLVYSTHIETNAVQIDPVFSALAPKAAGTLFGLLNLRVDMQGRGTGLEDLQRGLSGQGSLAIADGKITGAGLVDGLADFFDLDELRVLRFSKADGQLEIKQGRVEIGGNLAGRDVRLAPSGTVGLDGTLDIALPVRLAPALVARLDAKGKFSRFLTDAQGWGALPLQLGGSVTQPSFVLDTEALAGSLRRGVRQQLQKALQEKLLQPQSEGEEASTETGTDAESETKKQKTEKQLLEGVIKGLFD